MRHCHLIIAAKGRGQAKGNLPSYGGAFLPEASPEAGVLGWQLLERVYSGSRSQVSVAQPLTETVLGVHAYTPRAPRLGPK